MWVSSELQYSDGLTKASAAQLLADRLRSHLTRLKSDEDFVASKKKTAAERKKGAEEVRDQKAHGDDHSNNYVCSILHCCDASDALRDC